MLTPTVRPGRPPTAVAFAVAVPAVTSCVSGGPPASDLAHLSAPVLVSPDAGTPDEAGNPWLRPLALDGRP